MSKVKYAIDFDSAITNIYKLGSGLVLSEPTVAALNNDEKGEIKAVGVEASKLIGKTAKGTKTVFPVFEGEIINERVASFLLSSFLDKTGKIGFGGADVLFSVPCGVTFPMIEKFRKVAKNVGINKTYFIESPILSALGQRIPFTESAPCFVIDMAGGTTNIAAVSLDGVIAGVSVNFGSNKISADIIDYIAEKYALQIGLQTSERLKREIGSLEEGDGLSTVVNGRDMESGTPKALTIRAHDLIEPIREYYDKIAEISMELLKKLPPEVSAEIRHSGIYVSGVASSVYGLNRYYGKKFDMKVNVAENGLYSVAIGGGIALGNSEILKRLNVSTN